MLAYLLKSFWFALLPLPFTRFHFDQPAINCVDKQNYSTAFTKQNIPQEPYAQAHCAHIFKEFTKSKYCKSAQFWVCLEFACAFWWTNIKISANAVGKCWLWAGWRGVCQYVCGNAVESKFVFSIWLIYIDFIEFYWMHSALRMVCACARCV